ncbi:MAG: hypothetical protein AAB653_03870 [Patescibacteria group bacterium]
MKKIIIVIVGMAITTMMGANANAAVNFYPYFKMGVEKIEFNNSFLAPKGFLEKIPEGYPKKNLRVEADAICPALGINLGEGLITLNYQIEKKIFIAVNNRTNNHFAFEEQSETETVPQILTTLYSGVKNKGLSQKIGIILSLKKGNIGVGYVYGQYLLDKGYTTYSTKNGFSSLVDYKEEKKEEKTRGVIFSFSYDLPGGMNWKIENERNDLYKAISSSLSFDF